MHFSQLISPDVLERGLINAEDVINQNDPFHCECRAYGRLNETDHKDIAVQCYGYILLDQSEEANLERLGFTVKRRPAVKDRPIRGIVKEYVPRNGGPFTYDMLPRMRRDIQTLNELGIVCWDVRADNYRGGRLVDFSQAHTAPHMELEWDSPVYSRSQVMECCVRDQVCFDDMIEEWNDAHPDRIFWHRFTPSLGFGRRLRDPSRYLVSLHKLEGVRYSAAFYDWDKKGKVTQRSVSGNKQSRNMTTKRTSARGSVKKAAASTSKTKKTQRR